MVQSTVQFLGREYLVIRHTGQSKDYYPGLQSVHKMYLQFWLLHLPLPQWKVFLKNLIIHIKKAFPLLSLLVIITKSTPTEPLCLLMENGTSPLGEQQATEGRHRHCAHIIGVYLLSTYYVNK